MESDKKQVSRRDFLKGSAAVAATAALASVGTHYVYAAGSDTIKVGHGHGPLHHFHGIWRAS